jgi:hypothetical protein
MPDKEGKVSSHAVVQISAPGHNRILVKAYHWRKTQPTMHDLRAALPVNAERSMDTKSHALPN